MALESGPTDHSDWRAMDGWTTAMRPLQGRTRAVAAARSTFGALDGRAIDEPTSHAFTMVVDGDKRRPCGGTDRRAVDASAQKQIGVPAGSS